MNKILSTLFVAVILLCTVACQKNKFPVGKIPPPQNAPHYTAEPDITKSK
jgi:hypothetical protein